MYDCDLVFRWKSETACILESGSLIWMRKVRFVLYSGGQIQQPNVTILHISSKRAKRQFLGNSLLSKLDMHDNLHVLADKAAPTSTVSPSARTLICYRSSTEEVYTEPCLNHKVVANVTVTCEYYCESPR